MSSVDVEREAVALVSDDDGLSILYREGVRPEHFFDSSLRDVYSWSIDYFSSHGMMREAPSRSIVSSAFPFYVDVVRGTKGLKATFIAEEMKKKFARKMTEDVVKGAMMLLPSDPVSAVTSLVEGGTAILGLNTRKSNCIMYGEDDALQDLWYKERHSVDYLASGAPFPLKELHEWTGGIRKGEVWPFVAETGTGKAQPLYSKVLTEGGFVPMGDIRVGDRVRTRRGGLATVTGVFPQGKKQVHRVHLADGRSVDCCSEHLFLVDEAKSCRQRVMTVSEMMDEGLKQNRGWRFRLPLPEPMRFDKADLPIDPYALGVLIGDGSLTFPEQVSVSSTDAELIDMLSDALGEDYEIRKFQTCNYSWGISYLPKQNRNPLLRSIKSLGLNVRSPLRFIPEQYMNADAEQRLSLVQGLMDSDGSVGARGKTSFHTKSERLANDFLQLCWGLGFYAVLCPFDRGDKGVEYTVRFRSFGQRCVRLSRKQERIDRHEQSRNRFYGRQVSIVRIEVLGDEDMQCIMVDDDEHLYITDDFIVTHNTWFACAMALSAARAGWNVYFAELEMGVPEIAERIDVIATGSVSPVRYDRGELLPSEKAAVRDARKRVAGFPGKIVIDTPGRKERSVQSLLSRARSHDADLVIIDQLQFIRRAEGAESRTVQIEDIVGELKESVSAGGEESKMSVLLPAQFNREKSKSGGSDFLGDTHFIALSAAVEQIADGIISIGRSQEMEFINLMNIGLLKFRRGPKMAWELTWNLSTKFDMHVNRPLEQWGTVECST